MFTLLTKSDLDKDPLEKWCFISSPNSSALVIECLWSNWRFECGGLFFVHQKLFYKTFHFYYSAVSFVCLILLIVPMENVNLSSLKAEIELF